MAALLSRGEEETVDIFEGKGGLFFGSHAQPFGAHMGTASCLYLAVAAVYVALAIQHWH